jgi:hypothetical protein
MADHEHSHNHAPDPANRSNFELNPDQIDRSMEEVREDPQHILYDLEAAYLEFNNPRLSFLMCTAAEAVSLKDCTPFTEAALTAHKLLREAGTVGGVLPQLSESGRLRLIEIVLSAVRGAKLRAEQVSVSTIIKEAFFAELKQVPSLLAQTQKLAEHRTDRDAYYAGVCLVVAGLHSAVEELSE